ncbi:MAG: hypothetical protein K2N87_01990 [Eubacterium sp.]|nr:hypothetical protein [Eubacterium sp.]
MDQHISELGNRMEKLEQNSELLWETPADQYLSLGSRRKREQRQKKTEIAAIDHGDICRKMVDRALEILTEWEDIDDIKIQIQYAAIIVNKIANMKRQDLIYTDDLRKKICTLLRNVIRLNASAELFSKEQILLIKEGFSMIIAENVQKEDLFLLNRRLRRKGLETMPAWE